MRHTDHQIKITHDLTEQNWIEISQLQRLPFARIGKQHTFESQTFNFRWSEVTAHKVDMSGQIAAMKGLLYSVIGVRDPTAGAEQRNRLPWLHLVTSITPRNCAILSLGISQQIELTEHLLEGLN